MPEPLAEMFTELALDPAAPEISPTIATLPLFAVVERDTVLAEIPPPLRSPVDEIVKELPAEPDTDVEPVVDKLTSVAALAEREAAAREPLPPWVILPV